MLGADTRAMIAKHGPRLANRRAVAANNATTAAVWLLPKIRTSKAGIAADAAPAGTRKSARGLVLDQRSASQPPAVIPTARAAGKTTASIGPTRSAGTWRTPIKNDGSQYSKPPIANVVNVRPKTE